MAEECEERDFRWAQPTKCSHCFRPEWIYLDGPTKSGADDIFILISTSKCNFLSVLNTGFCKEKESRWHFTCRWQGTRCSQLSPEFGSSPTPWLDSPCPNLTPPTSMAMSQIVSRLSKTSSSKNFRCSQDLGYHQSNVLRLYKLLFSLSQISPASILGPVFVTNKILWS